jgi:tungstate transport system substrate-binding protein
MLRKFALPFVLLLSLAFTACAAPAAAPAATPHTGRLVLATTTSTQDSGLLDVILPDFEQQYGVKVDVIAVGTGQALKLGQDGNADVLLVHARAREDAFMAAGHGVRREDVMYNDFVIVGPASDPAGIRGMPSAARALRQISTSRSAFISRGDESGTHLLEQSLWAQVGLQPSGRWYLSAGQGMGEVLTMASEQLAYTLSDRATFLARSQAGLDLGILMEGDASLFNPYGVIAVSPAKGSHIEAALAEAFIDWITSIPVQEEIARYGVSQFGQPLFTPDSLAWRQAPTSQAP